MSGLPDTTRTKPHRRTAAPWHAALAAALIVVAVAIFVLAGGDENPKPAEEVHAGVEDIAVGTEDVPFPRSDTSWFDAGTPAVRVYLRVTDVPVAGRMVATVEHSGSATAFGALFGEPDVRAEDGGGGAALRLWGGIFGGGLIRRAGRGGKILRDRRPARLVRLRFSDTMGCGLSAAPGRAAGPLREGNIRRVTNSILNVMSLLLVGIGLAVALTFFVGSPASQAGAADNPQKVSQKTVERSRLAVVSPKVEKSLEKPPKVERKAKREVAPGPPPVEGPEDEALKVTIPAMGRIENATVPYDDGGNEAAFKRYVGVHLRGTGHPWERVANVYIAGHRLGYPGTDSFLAFWDLNRVGLGDRIILTDADGKRYTYKVFKKFVVEPTRVSVTRPLEGRNIVTLQTCTLPDYSNRLIVQAEKIA